MYFFSAYGLFLKTKEYGEKIIQDDIASWWIILLYTDDTVMLIESCNKVVYFFSAYGLFLKAKENGEKIIQDAIVSWWMILLYADDTVMLI